VVILQLVTGATEEYDGSTWTSNPTGLNTARIFRRLWYTNSGFRFWWCYPAISAATEEYDGSTWTTSPGSLNTARAHLGRCSGTQTAALAFGGYLLIQEQQKNMMELLGLHLLEV
jgi:hypothetical protein